MFCNANKLYKTNLVNIVDICILTQKNKSKESKSIESVGNFKKTYMENSKLKKIKR